jgi:ribosomal-protein-serine acetyltransferase
MNDRVAIRPYRGDETPLLYQAARESISEVNPWLPWCHEQYSEDEAKLWIEGRIAAFREDTEYQFNISDAAGAFLGGCGLNMIDRAHFRANLGYWVRSSACRRGVATQAVKALAAWAFANTDLIRLEIVVALGNAASLRVAEKAGARREGTLRKRLFFHGVAHDAAMFSLVRGDTF